MTTKSVKITEVLSMLRNGYTRDNTSKLYNREIGSIKEHYGLTNAELKLLFSHEKLKNLKTKPVPSLQIIDDTETPVEESGELTGEEIPQVGDEVEENTEAIDENTESAILF